MASDVFISYSSDDKSVAERVCDSVERRGVSCWIAPRDIAPGAAFDEAILDAIEGASAVVLILSERANSSPFVKNEINRAFAKGKTIFTFRVEDVTPGKSLEFYLARGQWTDGFPAPVEEKIKRMTAAILALLGREPPTEEVNAAAVTGSLASSTSANEAEVAPAATDAATPVVVPSYFEEISGRVVYRNGGEQTFSGFRSPFSGRLVFSQNIESLSEGNCGSAPSIDLDQVQRIDFSERPDARLRRGTARLRNGKTLENLFFYVGGCDWWEEPGFRGTVGDPAIVAVIITGKSKT